MGNHERTVDKPPLRALYSTVSMTKKRAWTMTFADADSSIPEEPASAK